MPPPPVGRCAAGRRSLCEPRSSVALVPSRIWRVLCLARVPLVDCAGAARLVFLSCVRVGFGTLWDRSSLEGRCEGSHCSVSHSLPVVLSRTEPRGLSFLLLFRFFSRSSDVGLGDEHPRSAFKRPCHGMKMQPRFQFLPFFTGEGNGCRDPGVQ